MIVICRTFKLARLCCPRTTRTGLALGKDSSSSTTFIAATVLAPSRVPLLRKPPSLCCKHQTARRMHCTFFSWWDNRSEKNYACNRPEIEFSRTGEARRHAHNHNKDRFARLSVYHLLKLTHPSMHV